MGYYFMQPLTIDLDTKTRWAEMKRPLLDFDYNPPIGKSYIKWKGGRYLGDLYAGKPYGRGRWYHADGTLGYSGDWINGKRCGEGREYENSYLLYSGEWKDDQIFGTGTLWDYSTKQIYRGEFTSRTQFSGKIEKMPI